MAYGGGRFFVQTLDGARSRITEEIRLAGAEDFAAAPDRSFDLPRRTNATKARGSAPTKPDPTATATPNDRATAPTSVESTTPPERPVEPLLAADARETNGFIMLMAIVGAATALTLAGILTKLRRRHLH